MDLKMHHYRNDEQRVVASLADYLAARSAGFDGDYLEDELSFLEHHEVSHELANHGIALLDNFAQNN